MSKSDKANKPISHVIFERFNPNPPKSASNSEPSNADEIITKYGIASRKIHIGLFHELDDFNRNHTLNSNNLYRGLFSNSGISHNIISISWLL